MKDYSVAFTNTAGGVFPNTSGVNASGPSATDGTEFVKLLIDDLWGARQDLMVEAGQTPSGNDEAVGSSDFVLALKHLIGGVKIQPIDAVLAANAMTVTLDKTWLDFRSQTLGSGTVNTRILPSAINVVVSSGSTLGAVSGVQSRIAVLAIDNAGTVELAVVNLAGGNNLDETTRITTVAEGGAGAADTANVIYSTTARANVPFRVVGYIESTQVTAGAWATNPSTIQGYGGQAFAAMSSIGYGQTRQDVIGSRALATPYDNTTGKPIELVVGVSSTVVTQIEVTINGVVFPFGSVSVTGVTGFGSIIIQPGARYSVDVAAGTPTLVAWSELR